MAEKEIYASTKLGDFVEGGGLIEGDLTWKNPRYEMFAYAGKGPEIPAFAIDLEPDEGDTQTQYYSAGSAADWAPSRDGKHLKRIGGADKVSKSSNFYALVKSLVEGGFPEDKTEDLVENTEGLKAHMVRVPQQKREGMEQKESKRVPMILLVDKVISMPGEGEEGAEAEDDLASEAIAMIVGILADNPKGMTKMKLTGEIFKKGQAEKMAVSRINEINKLIIAADDSFLKNGELWTYEKGTVKLKA